MMVANVTSRAKRVFIKKLLRVNVMNLGTSFEETVLGSLLYRERIKVNEVDGDLRRLNS